MRTTYDQSGLHDALKPCQSSLNLIDLAKLLWNRAMLWNKLRVVLHVVIFTKPQFNHTVQRQCIEDGREVHDDQKRDQWSY